jgi:hypothetical protein
MLTSKYTTMGADVAMWQEFVTAPADASFHMASMRDITKWQKPAIAEISASVWPR